MDRYFGSFPATEFPELKAFLQTEYVAWEPFLPQEIPIYRRKAH